MDDLDASLARLRRAFDERQARRLASPADTAQPPAVPPMSPFPIEEAPPPPLLEPEAQQSWADMIRRLFGR